MTFMNISQRENLFVLPMLFFFFNRQCFIKDVRANCFCASLLRTKFTRHVIHRGRALSSEVNTGAQIAIAMTMRGFNDLGRSVTPIFLSMSYFLCRFSTFCEKMKKIYRVEV